MKTIFLALIVIVILFSMTSCLNTTKKIGNEKPKEFSNDIPNHVVSKNLKNPSNRVSALKKYFKVRTDIIDTEFDIYDANLTIKEDREIPGATDYVYKVALLVDKKNLDTWKNDVDRVENQPNYDYKDFEKLVENNKNFKFTSKPIVYKDKNNSVDSLKYVIIFEDEGIVYFYLEQH